LRISFSFLISYMKNIHIRIFLFLYA
jgi:hypothetical protein